MNAVSFGLIQKRYLALLVSYYGATMSKTITIAQNIVYLMQGIPGSGKSTIASMIAHSTDGVILSTDEYWYEDGSYQYDPKRAGEAHQWNQRRCVNLMQQDVSPLIIDNTNITQTEAQPYLTFAKMYGYTVQVIRVEANTNTCIARQANRTADRRIPEDVISDKAYRMERIVV
jgi:predicted kinase